MFGGVYEAMNKSSELEMQEQKHEKKKKKNRNIDANDREMRKKREGDVCLRKVSVDLNNAALFISVQRGEVFLRCSSFSSWCSYKFQLNAIRSSAALYHRGMY